MPDRTKQPRGERRWVLIAIAIILLGIVVATLHRLDYVSLAVGTAGTVLMGIGALLAAWAAARTYRNEDHG
jgi:protein-S-isoprenylcysteine O-methyltransferase Ste14